MKHLYRTAALLALCLGFFILPAAAEGVTVTLQGTPIPGALLERDTTWVPLRRFCEALGSTVGWDGESQTITVEDKNFSARIALGDKTVEADGRFFWLSEAPFCRDGVTYLPVRGLAKLYGLDVGWDGENMAVTLTGGSPFADGTDYYDSTDLYWLSRIIFAESGNEPLEGQVAVGNVVLNRAACDQYPDTIKGVIFDKKYGVQFTPSTNGAIYKTPSEESVMAAKLVLEGARTVPENTLYFIATKVSETHWIKRACQLITTIGGHGFFADK